jgi:hypothetical protein
MPKKYKSYNNPNYFRRAADQSNRVLNLSQAFAEKLGVESPIDKAFSAAIPMEISQGFRQVTANTSNPSRPRAQAIAYNSETNTLYVVFRDGTWWEYRNCPAIHWQNLQTTDSTGKYLRESGLDAWPDMGPANVSDLPEDGGLSASSKELLSYAAEVSKRMQADTEF